MSAVETPLFPLETVLFPGSVFPIVAGRPRSIRAAQQAMREERPVGILMQRDPKVVLAYSTVSQMGYLSAVVGIALAQPALAPAAVASAVVYAVHHGLAKGALFLGVPVWKHHRSDRSRWLVVGGLTIAGLAVVGAPFTSGALGKYATKTAVEGANLWGLDLVQVLPFVATVSTVLLTRFTWLLLHTEPDPLPVGSDPELPAWLVIVLAALVLLCLGISAWSGPLMRFFEATARSLHDPQIYIETVLGSRMLSRSLSSRWVMPSSRHSSRRKRHWPMVTPCGTMRCSSVTVHGSVYAFGSSTVTSISSVPPTGSRQRRHSPSHGAATVVLRGTPIELLLHAFGRSAVAHVEADGGADAVLRQDLFDLEQDLVGEPIPGRLMSMRHPAPAAGERPGPGQRPGADERVAVGVVTPRRRPRALSGPFACPVEALRVFGGARGRVLSGGRHFFAFSTPTPAPSWESAAMKASCGTSTEPTIFIRFLPSFCFSSSLRLRLMSPP